MKKTLVKYIYCILFGIGFIFSTNASGMEMTGTWQLFEKNTPSIWQTQEKYYFNAPLMNESKQEDQSTLFLFLKQAIKPALFLGGLYYIINKLDL